LQAVIAATPAGVVPEGTPVLDVPDKLVPEEDADPAEEPVLPDDLLDPPQPAIRPVAARTVRQAQSCARIGRTLGSRYFSRRAAAPRMAADSAVALTSALVTFGR
jgi:hypothetical protein